MRKIVIFTLVSFILSSCSIEKRLAKYCPLCPTETERVVEYRDTTITVEVPGETVTVVDSLYCDSLGNVYSTRILERDSQILSLRTRLQNNRYTVDCESDTVYVDKLIKGNDVYITETVKVKVPYKPWWMVALSWIGAIFIIILAGAVALKYFRVL